MLVSSKSKYDVRGGIYHQLGVQNPWFLPKKREATMHDNDGDDDDDGMKMRMVMMMMMMMA